jgi:dephospho-CoA kinase
VVEAIKLVEGGLASLCDEVWLVTCEAGEQLERLLARGTIAADDAQSRIAAQLGLTERLTSAATRVIDTSRTLEDTAALVRAAWDDALRTTGAR